MRSIYLYLFLFATLAILRVTDGAGQSFLAGVIRDQAPRELRNLGNNRYSFGDAGSGFQDTDFEQSLDRMTTEKGIVGKRCSDEDGWNDCGKIGSDRTPVYPRTGASVTVRSPQSFYKWFHNSPDTRLENISLPMTPLFAGSAQYEYRDTAFFPINGKGWKDWAKIGNNPNRNFGFCLESHAYFGYSGGEVFEFTGDDDVFVYINDMLVIDLGGVHTAQTQKVYLDRIPGLEKQQNYRFDFFYCERHTEQSQLTIQTTMVFECPTVDFCGVCLGNGMSCCSDKCPDDGNQCTIESCTAKGCTVTNKQCPEKPCMNVKCNTRTGDCEYTDKVCSNTDPCKKNTCNVQTGYCEQSDVCRDNLGCTEDTCKNGNCTFTSKCNDGNPCTVDSCGLDGKCKFDTIRCPASSSKCSDNTCVNGACVEIRKTCNDSSLCTEDTCNELTGMCEFSYLCDIGLCMTSTCDKARGCSHVPKVCNDGNACTRDTCSNSTGCDYAPIQCNDFNICTEDKCDRIQGCVFTNVTRQCDYDVCRLKNGTSVTCTSEDLCYSPVCDEVEGCKKVWNCDDGDMCTDDTCVGGKCVHTARGCPGATLCNPQQCNRATGICEDRIVTCNNPDACQIGQCVASTGRCAYNTKTCVTENPCNPQVCRNGACVADTPFSCSSPNKCINSTCANVGGVAECQYNPLSCPQDICNPTQCNSATGTCDPLPKPDCDDNNPCTSEELVCGDAGLTCNRTVSTFCDDDNLCTLDSCSQTANETCSHTNRTDCVATNLCEVAGCNPETGCFTSPLVCPPTTDLCQTAKCDPISGCLYTSKVCEAGDVNCFIGECSASTGECSRKRRSNFGSAMSSDGITTCLLRYDDTAKAVAISTGAAVGIAIGAAAFVGLAGFGGKKGYDLYQHRFSGKDAMIQDNPLYVQSEQSGVNPLFDPTEASH